MSFKEKDMADCGNSLNGSCYYFGGSNIYAFNPVNYYFVITFYDADGGIKYEMKKHEQNDDGSYKMTLSYTVYCCGNGEFPTGTVIVNTALKEDTGQRYTLSSIPDSSEELPGTVFR